MLFLKIKYGVLLYIVVINMVIPIFDFSEKMWWLIFSKYKMSMFSFVTELFQLQ